VIDYGIGEAASGVITLGAVCGVLLGVIRWCRPRFKGLRRDFIAGRDALVGRDPIFDSMTGKEIAPAVPGIGTRMANVEEAIVTIARHQTAIADLNTIVADLRLNDARHDVHLARHDKDLADLKLAQVERIVSRAESTQMFKTVEVALNAQPPVDAESDEEQ
jgi:hypothetical protein